MSVAISVIVADYVRRFAQGHCSFLGPGSKKSGNESGHLVVCGSSVLERGDLKCEGKRESIHVNGSDETVDMILGSASIGGSRVGTRQWSHVGSSPSSPCSSSETNP